jgi:hypothetical protein
MKQLLRKLPNRKLFHSSTYAADVASLSLIGAGWMADRLYYEPRELEYLEYKQYAVQEYEELMQSFTHIPSTMEAARTAGVSHEWELYRFFAEIDAPREVFRYVDDQGDIALFTDSEIEQIRNWSGSSPYPVPGIEGHHLQTIKENPDNLELAASPDNILLATEEGHRMHLHGGNTQNPTQPGYMEEHWTSDQMLDVALRHAQEEMVPGMAELGLISIGGSAALYTTVGLTLRALELRKDPRPWVQKRDALYRAAIGTALTGGVLATAGWTASAALESLFAHLPEDLLSSSMETITAINGAFAAVTLTAGLLSYIRSVRSGKDVDAARAEFKSVMMVAAGELLAFQALGLGAEFLGDMLADTFLDALIPDPTGFLLTLRFGYSMFKLLGQSIQRHQNKTAMKRCRDIRLDHLYRQALLPFRAQLKHPYQQALLPARA